MISPEEYAAAVAKALPADISIHVVHGEGVELLYEFKMGDKLMARMERDPAIAFLDGLIAGVKLERQRERPGT